MIVSSEWCGVVCVIQRLSSQCRDRSSKTSNSSSCDTVNSHCAPQSMPVAASVASASSGGMVADSRGVSVNDSLGVSVDDSLGVSVNDSRGVPVDDSRGVSVNDSRGVSVDDSRGVSVNDADDDSATCTLHQLDVSQQLIVKKSVRHVTLHHDISAAGTLNSFTANLNLTYLI